MKTQPNHLKRILGIGFGLAVVIGGTIGVGILRMPAIIAKDISNPYLFISLWVVGGLITLLGAFIYAELGTRFPLAGGAFVFAEKAFGKAGGFFTGWSDWIVNAGAISYLAIAFGEYLNTLIGLHLPVRFASSAIIILFAAMQWQGIQISSNFQKIMSALKALGLLLLVMACFAYFFKGTPYSDAELVYSTSSIPLLSAIILSLRAVYVTYGGWNSAIYFTEEDSNPGKNLPRSLIGGVLSIMIIYLLVNIALLAVLPLPIMAKSSLPAADAAQLIFGGNGGIVVTVIAVISLLGIMNAVLLSAPRTLFAVSRAGLFFHSASILNKHSIPGNALIITTLVSVLFTLTGAFNLVVSISAVLGMLVNLSVYISFIFIRKQSPSVKPPFKAWGYPFSAIIMIIISLSLIVGLFIEDTLSCIYSVIILALAIPFYLIFEKRLRKNKKSELTQNTKTSH